MGQSEIGNYGSGFHFHNASNYSTLEEGTVGVKGFWTTAWGTKGLGVTCWSGRLAVCAWTLLIPFATRIRFRASVLRLLIRRSHRLRAHTCSLHGFRACLNLGPNSRICKKGLLTTRLLVSRTNWYKLRRSSLILLDTPDRIVWDSGNYKNSGTFETNGPRPRTERRGNKLASPASLQTERLTSV